MSAITAKARRKMKKYAVLTREPRCFLGSFDFSWEQRKLGELGTITTGNTPSTSIPDYYSDDGIVWVTPTDICENITFESARKLSDLGQQVGRVVPKNTILVTCIASIGKNTMLGNTGSFNQQINGLTPNENKYDPYFLLTESALWSAKMKGSAAAGTMQIVNRTEFSELKTWLPSLIEQQAIGAFFKQLDHLITLHQRKCVFLFSFFRACISMNFTASTFSWEQRKAIDIADYSKGNGYSKGDLADAGTPIILYGRLYTKYQFAISEVDTFAVPRNGAVYSQGNEVIVPASGETAEDIARASAVEKSGVLLGGDLNILRPFDFMNPLFLALAISNGEPQKELAKKAQGKSVVHIHNTDIQEVTIAYPSKTEQDRIVSVFRQLDNLITLHLRECISFTESAGRLILTANKKRTASSWEQRKFSDITFPAGEKNRDNLPLESYSITNEHGFVPQDEKFENGGTMREADKRMYYIVSPNSFAYNPARINVGSIGYQNIGKNVIVSSLYEVFKTSEDVDDRLLWHWFKSPDFQKLIMQLQEGGVRLYFYYDKLCMGEVSLPSLEEQRKIGKLFDTLDNLITLHQRKPFLMKWRTSDANRNQTNRLVL